MSTVGAKSSQTEWYAWEIFLWKLSKSPKLSIVVAIAILIITFPLLLLLVPLVPVFVYFGMGKLPAPRGQYDVSSKEVEWRLMGEEQPMNKVRLFYPADEEAVHGVAGGKVGVMWLPQPAKEYASGV